MDTRLNKNTIVAFGGSHAIDYPTPINLSYFWGFGFLSYIFVEVKPTPRLVCTFKVFGGARIGAFWLIVAVCFFICSIVISKEMRDLLLNVKKDEDEPGSCRVGFQSRTLF